VGGSQKLPQKNLPGGYLKIINNLGPRDPTKKSPSSVISPYNLPSKRTGNFLTVKRKHKCALPLRV
jgi:hypothetical protein